MAKRRNPELTALIVQKAALGETKKRIADELNTSQPTVTKHLQAIKAEHEHRISQGEDPQEAFGIILAEILIGAGVAGAILAGMKIFEELYTYQQKASGSPHGL